MHQVRKCCGGRGWKTGTKLDGGAGGSCPRRSVGSDLILEFQRWFWHYIKPSQELSGGLAALALP